MSVIRNPDQIKLNTTLTISLFRIPPDKNKPGYQTAHSEYWKPFVSRLFEHVVAREGKYVVFGLWGSWAKGFKKQIKAAAKEVGRFNLSKQAIP